MYEFIEHLHNIQSNSFTVHYFVMNKSFTRTHSKYVGIITFHAPLNSYFIKLKSSVFHNFNDQQTLFSRSISIPSHFNIYISTPVPDQISVISHSYNWIHPVPQAQIFGDACVGPRCPGIQAVQLGKEASLALPLADHSAFYIEAFLPLINWFVVVFRKLSGICGRFRAPFRSGWPDGRSGRWICCPVFPVSADGNIAFLFHRWPSTILVI